MVALIEQQLIPVTYSAVARRALEIGVAVMEIESGQRERRSVKARAAAYLSHPYVEDDMEAGRCARCGKSPEHSGHLREGETRESRIAALGEKELA